MVRWEYCILSGIETSLKRKLTVELSFSSGDLENKTEEIDLDRSRNEETATAQFLGELGREGWEAISFNRHSSRFEAILKRPVELGVTRTEGGFEINAGFRD